MNIGPAQQRRRRRLGLVGLASAGSLLAADLALGLPAAVDVAIALLLFGGFSGVFQARAKT